MYLSVMAMQGSPTATHWNILELIVPLFLIGLIVVAIALVTKMILMIIRHDQRRAARKLMRHVR